VKTTNSFVGRKKTKQKKLNSQAFTEGATKQPGKHFCFFPEKEVLLWDQTYPSTMRLKWPDFSCIKVKKAF